MDTGENFVLLSTDELVLKSGPVRALLERMLRRQVRWMLRKHGHEKAEVINIAGRMLIKGFGDAGSAALAASKVFGVAYASPALAVEPDLEVISEEATRLAEGSIRPGETFAVRAHRVGAHPFTSGKLEATVGEAILRRLGAVGIRVNLENPERIIYVEVRQDRAYIYALRIPGPGGLPVGSQGKLLGLVDGGGESAAAFYLMMKRGSLVSPLYFDDGDTSKLEASLHILERVRELVPVSRFKVFVVPTHGVADVLSQNCPKDIVGLIQRRLQYRIAERIAGNLRAAGIVDGERLAGRSAVNLRTLNLLSGACKLPIFRPLLGLSDSDVSQILSRMSINSDLVASTISTQFLGNPSRGIEEVIRYELQVGAELLADRLAEQVRRVTIAS